MSSSMVDEFEMRRTLRDMQPSHYIFKIESFSVLLETIAEDYESESFQAGGYEWKLSFYPNGNKERDGKDYISLYLVISDTNNLPCGWEVNVVFKLFVFDHIHDKYLTVEDVDVVRRFHGMKTKWGFEKFLSLEEFQNPSNGYLIDDTCIFGAEVFVMKYEGEGDCLSMTKLLTNNTCSWTVDGSSLVRGEFMFSEQFNIGGRNWMLCLYPEEDGEAMRGSLSVYLQLADSEKLPVKPNLYANYKLRIRNQIRGRHHGFEARHWFGEKMRSWGFRKLIHFSDLYDKSKGFMVNDTIVVEVEIIMLSVTKKLHPKKRRIIFLD